MPKTIFVLISMPKTVKSLSSKNKIMWFSVPLLTILVYHYLGLPFFCVCDSVSSNLKYLPLWFQRCLIVNDVFQDQVLPILIEFLRSSLWTNLGLLVLVACWGINFMIILLSFKSVSDLFPLQALQNARQNKTHFLNGDCEQQNKTVIP